MTGIFGRERIRQQYHEEVIDGKHLQKELEHDDSMVPKDVRSCPSEKMRIFSNLTYMKTHQSFQFFSRNHSILCDEEVKMFVKSICVWFSTQFSDPIEVMNVDVDENTEKTSQNFLADLTEIFWE